MGHAIIFDDGIYFLWSTVVDAPITPAMNRAEMREHCLWRYGASEGDSIDRALVRADETGTSFLTGYTQEDLKRYNRAGPREGTLSWPNVLKLVRRDRDVSEAEKVGAV